MVIAESEDAYKMSDEEISEIFKAPYAFIANIIESCWSLPDA
jgi:hypothetical protein